MTMIEKDWSKIAPRLSKDGLSVDEVEQHRRLYTSGLVEYACTGGRHVSWRKSELGKRLIGTAEGYALLEAQRATSH